MASTMSRCVMGPPGVKPATRLVSSGTATCEHSARMNDYTDLNYIGFCGCLCEAGWARKAEGGPVAATDCAISRKTIEQCLTTSKNLSETPQELPGVSSSPESCPRVL